MAGDKRHATSPRYQATETSVYSAKGMFALCDFEGMIGTVSVYVCLCICVTKHLALCA